MRYARREFFTDKELYADRLFVSEDTFAVADGMGIGIGGKLAAEKAISLVGERRPFRSVEELRYFFEEANRAVMEEIAKLGDRHIAGTTLSVLSIVDKRFLVGHVGDSRIYLLRGDSLELLTKDQVTLKGGKKYVTSLGVEWKPDVHTAEGDLRKEDTFLVISDGAVNVLSEEDIKSILRYDVEESAEMLLNLHKKSGKEEDLSFVIVRVD